MDEGTPDTIEFRATWVDNIDASLLYVNDAAFGFVLARASGWCAVYPHPTEWVAVMGPDCGTRDAAKGWLLASVPPTIRSGCFARAELRAKDRVEQLRHASSRAAMDALLPRIVAGGSDGRCARAELLVWQWCDNDAVWIGGRRDRLVALIAEALARAADERP